MRYIEIASEEFSELVDEINWNEVEEVVVKQGKDWAWFEYRFAINGKNYLIKASKDETGTWFDDCYEI